MTLVDFLLSFRGDDTDFKKDNFKMTGDEGDSAKTKCQKS